MMIFKDSLGIKYVKIKLNAYFLVFIKKKFGNKVKIYMLLMEQNMMLLLISLNHAMKIATCWSKLELMLLGEIKHINYSILRNFLKVSKILFIIKKGSGPDNKNEP